jgi:hypothetical protein
VSTTTVTQTGSTITIIIACECDETPPDDTAPAFIFNVATNSQYLGAL